MEKKHKQSMGGIKVQQKPRIESATKRKKKFIVAIIHYDTIVILLFPCSNIITYKRCGAVCATNTKEVKQQFLMIGLPTHCMMHARRTVLKGVERRKGMFKYWFSLFNFVCTVFLYFILFLEGKVALIDSPKIKIIKT